MAERYKAITLTQGCSAIVSPEDYDWLNQWKWCVHFTRKTAYAMRKDRGPRSKRTLYMHRVITGVPAEAEVDHHDRNGLNNTRGNLRVTDAAGNQRNQGRRSDNVSGFKGVHLSKGKYWVAHIQVEGHRVHLGTFPTAEAASRAYDTAAMIHFGEFAWLNFPDS